MENKELKEVQIFVTEGNPNPENYTYGIVIDNPNLAMHGNILYTGTFLLEEEEIVMMYNELMTGSFFSVKPEGIDAKVEELLQRKPIKLTHKIPKPEKPN